MKRQHPINHENNDKKFDIHYTKREENKFYRDGFKKRIVLEKVYE
jgi:hypothetical protein